VPPRHSKTGCGSPEAWVIDVGLPVVAPTIVTVWPATIGPGYWSWLAEIPPPSTSIVDDACVSAAASLSAPCSVDSAVLHAGSATPKQNVVAFAEAVIARTLAITSAVVRGMTPRDMLSRSIGLPGRALEAAF